MVLKCDEWRSKATHRIVIEQRNSTPDNYGGFTTTWATQSTVWAAIEPLTGRELFLQQQKQSRVKSKITIRYQSGLKNTATTGALRVSYDNRIFPVVYMRNLSEDFKNEGKQYQELYVEENAPEGS